jgi:hypothetical protein
MKKSTVQVYFTPTGSVALYYDDKTKPSNIDCVSPQFIHDFIVGILLELSSDAWVEVMQLDDEGFYKRISNQQ